MVFKNGARRGCCCMRGGHNPVCSARNRKGASWGKYKGYKKIEEGYFGSVRFASRVFFDGFFAVGSRFVRIFS
jgi:hypothetical protein